MKNKGKPVLRFIVLTSVALLLVIASSAWWIFRVEIQAIDTIKKLNDNLYYLEYSGDYGFSEFLKQGGAASDEELGEYLAEFLSKGLYKYQPLETPQGCSTIAARSPEGDFVFGRNFDWENCVAMVVKTIPDDGYASISTSNLNFLGFGQDFLPEGFQNKLLSLAAIYVPLDGMNEKGLCVADLMIEYPEETHQNTGKPSLTTTSAIRLILDHAATVEEAIALLESYDMHSSASIMHHLAISDAAGKSVVVEYIENVMRVTETKIVTNFFLTQGVLYGIGSEASKQRFQVLKEEYDQTKGIMTLDDLKTALIAVRQSLRPEENWLTQWSIVYNQSDLALQLFHKEEYQTAYSFSVTQ